jgi:DNA-binding NtrC family response regulator
MSASHGSQPRMPEGGTESDFPAAGLARLQREGLTSVMVVGGSTERRDQVARAFHRESPLHDGPFVSVDCGHDEERLRAALTAWLEPDSAAEPNPYRAAERGTLYLDQVERLSPDSQRLLLALARRLGGGPITGGDAPCAGRLITGNPNGLAEAVAAGRFMSELLDALDRVRVQLEASPHGESAG